MIYQNFLRPLLFALSRNDPETAHEHALRLLEWFDSDSGRRRFLLSVSGVMKVRPQPKYLMGLTFFQPVGLAAGFDKNAVAVRALGDLGFGFVEVGTVTPRPQDGNPRPRIFRLGDDRALINRMGFPSQGADAVAARLAARPWLRDVPLGVNIGKNKDTPLHKAAGDYREVMKKLYEYADYLVINVSSPNTPGLRSLQGKEELDWLLGEVMEENVILAQEFAIRHPVLVKLSPDLTEQALDEALEILVKHGVSGVIATNTTLSRDGLSAPVNETGGLSGAPLRQRALDAVSHVRRRLPYMPLIGVGGVDDADSARTMLDAGADLVQLYTGLIYRGPFLAVAIARALAETPAIAPAPKAKAPPGSQVSPKTP